MSAQINLYNAELNQKKLTFSARIFAQILGLMVLGMVSLTWYLNYQTVQLEQQINSNKAQLTNAQAQLAKVSADYPPRTRSKALENRIGLLDAEIKSLLMAEDLLKHGDFGNAQGYSSYLSAIARQSLDGVWLTQVSVGEAGRALGLRGRAVRAELVPQFIGRLAGEAALRGKAFDALEMRRVTEVVRGAGNAGVGNGGNGGNVGNSGGTGSNLSGSLAGAVSTGPNAILGGNQNNTASNGTTGSVLNNASLNAILGNLNLGGDVRRILNQLSSGDETALAAPRQTGAATTPAGQATPTAQGERPLPTVSSIEFSLQAHPPQKRGAVREGK
jgi:hypothetical protein